MRGPTGPLRPFRDRPEALFRTPPPPAEPRPDPLRPMTEQPELHIESSLPKIWEEEHTFNDILFEWMDRAPWLALSALAHALGFVILMAIPWHLLSTEEVKVIEASIEQTPEDVWEEPPEEEPEEIEEEEPTEEPVLQDAEITDEVTEQPTEQGDPDFLSDAPFESESFNNVIGIGGGAGGKFGGRFGRGGRAKGGGKGTEQALRDALEWLAKHQSPDGSWDVDGFMGECGKIGSNTCEGPGEAPHDVGITGLALLAFLGDGNTTREGEYKDVVNRGINWIKDQQNPDTGLLGEKLGHAFIYNHAIATLAVTEAYYFSKSPLIKRTAQDAINYITTARNPYSAWRYDVPPVGDNDTSVTGWMVFALKSAEDAGLKIDPEAYVGSLSWFDEVTDPSTGRCGYIEIGQRSSRIERVNDSYPDDKTEAMTAVALLCRFFLGQDPKEVDVMERHAELMLQMLPEWDPDGLTCDMYYWYYGSYAMYQMGDKYWTTWQKAMEPAVVGSQRKEGDEKGSWDPIGPWGFSGGRVYSTATMALCLEVYFRYAKVLGAR